MGLLGVRSAAGSFGCKVPDHIEQSDASPFVGNLTFYHFNMIVSGACTGVVLFVTLGLMGRHAARMSNPNEQLKIMRICNLIPSYQIISYISICFPNTYIYLQGFIEVLQGVALYAFLMLLCDFMAPTDTKKVEFFSSLETKRQWQPKKKRNGLEFLSLTWYSVLQYPVVTWITAIAQVVTQYFHVYCLDSTAPHFSHVWTQVATSASTSVAVNAILQFYMNMKGYMTEHRPLLKLVAFKLVVGLVLLEKILFLALTGTNVLKASGALTYVDVMMGLPTMVICVQMVPISLFMLYAYRTKPYEIARGPRTLRPQEYQAVDSDGDEETLMTGFQKRYQGGRFGLHAWAAYLNPLALFRDVKSAYAMIHTARAVQKANAKQLPQEEMSAYATRYDSGEGA